MRIAILVLAALASSVFGCEQTIVSCTNSKITSNVAIVTDPAWSEVGNGVSYTSQTAFTLSQPVRFYKFFDICL
jgi:hypothetical protein